MLFKRPASEFSKLRAQSWRALEKLHVEGKDIGERKNGKQNNNKYNKIKKWKKKVRREKNKKKKKKKKEKEWKRKEKKRRMKERIEHQENSFSYANILLNLVDQDKILIFL